MPRIQIPLTITAIVMSGLAAPVTQASASTTETPELVATIPVGATPYGIAVTPDGSKVYVSNSTGGSVSVIDTSTRAAANTITSNIGSTPVGIAINPAGTTAYVGNYTAGTITTIDVASSATFTYRIDDGTGHSCRWILNPSVSFDGSKLFLACQDDSSVQVLDLPLSPTSRPTGRRLAETGNNCFPTDSAVTSDDATLVVAVNGPGPAPGVFPCDAMVRNTALIIDVATGAIGNTYVPATDGAFSVAISPLSGLAYLAGQTSGAIAVVNPSTRSSAGASIAVGGSLTDIVITPDGSQAIVSVIDEDVVKFIDLDTGTVTHTVGVGGTDPQSIALSRDGRFLYTANRSGSVGVVEVPVPPISSTASDGTPMYALELSAGPDARCSTAELLARRNTWMELPESSSCAVSGYSAEAVLLGWATSVDFPLEIARRQVDNGWGAYETFDEEGRLSGVFIPAGGATVVSAPGKLHAIWSSPGRS